MKTNLVEVAVVLVHQANVLGRIDKAHGIQAEKLVCKGRMRPAKGMTRQTTKRTFPLGLGLATRGLARRTLAKLGNRLVDIAIELGQQAHVLARMHEALLGEFGELGGEPALSLGVSGLSDAN